LGPGGRCQAGQMASLNALKSRMLWPERLVRARPWNGLRKGLKGLGPGGRCQAGQMASLNALKSRMLWPEWLVRAPAEELPRSGWRLWGLVNRLNTDKQLLVERPWKRGGPWPWKSRFHASGGPRRRPCLGQGRGRRIIFYFFILYYIILYYIILHYIIL
jgi:hypothetical protein